MLFCFYLGGKRWIYPFLISFLFLKSTRRFHFLHQQDILHLAIRMFNRWMEKTVIKDPSCKYWIPIWNTFKIFLYGIANRQQLMLAYILGKSSAYNFAVKMYCLSFTPETYFLWKKTVTDQPLHTTYKNYISRKLW